MGCAGIQRLAGNPDRHDALMPARSGLFKRLPTDPLDRAGFSTNQHDAIPNPKSLNMLFAAICED